MVALALILVAVVLLLTGLSAGTTTLLVASVAASLSAAVLLVVHAHRAAADRGTGPGRGAPAAGGPRRPTGGVHPDDDPADEPGVEPVPPADADRLARSDEPVRVLDGRPRYHLPRCPVLGDRRATTMPVREAVGLGFTPCDRCRPVRALLAAVRHG